MSLDPVSINAFRDELEKTAFIGRLAGRMAGRIGQRYRNWRVARSLARRPGEGVMSHWMRKGWHEMGHGGARGGWMGKPGTWRENIPIGGKSLFLGFGALGLPGALKEEDPSGQGRSRFERLTRLGLGNAGMLMGTGALVRPGNKLGLGKSLIGGIGGMMAGEYLAGLPFRGARQMRAQQGPLSPQDRRQLMAQGQPMQRPTAQPMPQQGLAR